MIKKIRINIFFLGFALTLSACGSTKILLGSGDIEFQYGYTQKFVPGMEGSEIREYLFIGYTYVDLEVAIMDSVQFRGARYNVRQAKGELKIDLARKKELFTLNSEVLLPNEAMLYYHVGDEIYKFKITGIEEKETVYMP